MAAGKRDNKINVREIAKVLVCISQFSISMLVPIAMCCESEIHTKFKDSVREKKST